MNSSQKGSKKEAECLAQLHSHLTTAGYHPIISWRVKRAGGAFARFQGGNDFLADKEQGITGFDLAILCREGLTLVQVDDAFEQKRWDSLRRNWARLSRIADGVLNCYYAVYNNEPKLMGQSERDIDLPGFWLLRVQ